MNKHTPGPWHVGGKLDAIVYAPDGYAVAGCQTYHGLRDEQSTTANARLIACAPHLLASLRRVLRMLEVNDARLANFGEVEEARAIISRAEGAPYWGE